MLCVVMKGFPILITADIVMFANERAAITLFMLMRGPKLCCVCS